MKCNENVLNHCKMYNVGISLFCLPVLYMQRSFNFTLKNGEKNGIISTLESQIKQKGKMCKSIFQFQCD